GPEGGDLGIAYGCRRYRTANGGTDHEWESDTGLATHRKSHNGAALLLNERGMASRGAAAAVVLFRRVVRLRHDQSTAWASASAVAAIDGTFPVAIAAPRATPAVAMLIAFETSFKWASCACASSVAVLIF